MGKRSFSLYIAGILLLFVLFACGFVTLWIGYDRSKEGKTDAEVNPWAEVYKDVPWEKVPWKDFPDDFPWEEVPWEEFPDDTKWEEIPWEEVPWEKLPDDFPTDKVDWEEIPWEEIPDDFPWEEVPWDDLPENFPWDKFPGAHEHVYGEWIAILPATCGTAGAEVRFCELCARAETEEVPPTGEHIFKNSVCAVCGIHKIVVESASYQKVYDGSPLRMEEVFVREGELLEGHRVVAEGYASLNEVGVTENRFVSLRIEDGEGRDVTHSYVLEAAFGTLEVTKREVTIETLSFEKPYDGEPLRHDEFTVVGLAEGHVAILTFGDGQTECGSSDNFATVKIVDEEGNDVSSDYAITLRFGRLTVR